MSRDLCLFSCGPKTIKLILGAAEGAVRDIHFPPCLNSNRGVVGTLQGYLHMPECQGGVFYRPESIGTSCCLCINYNFFILSALQRDSGLSARFDGGFFTSTAG